MQMGANVTVTAGLDEGTCGKKTRTGTTDASHSHLPQSSMQESIAKLAYALWQQRGCPEGSPEFDWLEAERTVSEFSEDAPR